MKNRFVYMALILSVILLVLLGRIYINQNRLQIGYTQDVEHTYQVIITLRNCEQTLVNAESSQRGFLLTRAPQFRESCYEELGRIDSIVAHLAMIISDNPSERVNIKLLAPAISERVALLKFNMDLTGQEADFRDRVKKGSLIMDKIYAYIAMMEKEEYALLLYRNREKDRYQELNYSFLKYAFVFACFICIASMLLIIRELRMRIRSQKMLEQTVFELKKSTDEIEQVSFAASHDLQEPLRKIRTLSTLLTTRYGNNVPVEEKDILSRINRSSERMHNLLENLIDFTNLVKRPEKITQVAIDRVFMRAYDKVMDGAQDVLLQKTDALPIIMGYEQQLLLLFTQLLSNSLQYRQPGKQLLIEVSHEIRDTQQKEKFWQKKPVYQYHAVTIRDNGIGFDNAFNEKIFSLFQRLHTQTEYAGKGIGLTIARRIMTNHYGFIEAAGEKGKGAAFTLCFPLV